MLPKELVEQFVSMGLIYEDEKHHNAVFVGTDAQGNPKYAHLRGTKDKFRMDVAGSDKSYGFCYRGKGTELYVFEVPIDLLSHIALYPAGWEERNYLSLGGVSPKALERFLSERKDIESIYIRMDEEEWIRLENQHEAIVDRELFERANALHPKKAKGYSETRTNYTLPRKEKKPAFLVCGHCGHGLVADSAHRLKCTDGRTSGDDVCRRFVVKREILEENILAYVRQFAKSMLEERRTSKAVRQNMTKDNVPALTKRMKQISSL